MTTDKNINMERLNETLAEFADYMEARYDYFSKRSSFESSKNIDPKFKDSNVVYQYRMNIALLANGAPTIGQEPANEEEAKLKESVMQESYRDWGNNGSTYFVDILKGDSLKDNPDAQRILHTQNQFIVSNTPGPVVTGLVRGFCEVAGLFGATKLRNEVRAMKVQHENARRELGLK